MSVSGRDVVMCDFDGTITEQDTAEWILDKHAEGDWRALDEDYVQGRIGLLACMSRQFSMIKAPREQILRELEASIAIRPGFPELVELCVRKGVEVLIVSAGLDFVIQRFLRILGVDSLVSVHSATTYLDDGHIGFRFPPLAMPGSKTFKDDIVRQAQARKVSVTYIGDGMPDLEACALADHRFAVRGRRLETGLRGRGLRYVPFSDFHEILPEVERILGSDGK